MREYIAETGGRYTYTDDLLNLQELTLSMTSIFEGCSNFIISGCFITGTEITPGYVWINGKVRHYEGNKNVVFPYYIYEKNNIDTTTYANEVNKRGRCNYLCAGAKTVPTQPDVVTNSLPGYIEVKKDYAPRFIDKFFGKYAVLLETPFAKQTIKKDLVLTGMLSVEKDFESKTSVCVANPTNGYSIKNLVKTNGDASIGAYLNGLLINEIVINTDGSFSFVKQGRELAKITDGMITYANATSTTYTSGSIHIYENNIINITDNSDAGAVSINASGYQKGLSKFRDFKVFNGKNSSSPIFHVTGKENAATITGLFTVSNKGNGIILNNPQYGKDEKQLTNQIIWTDKSKNQIAILGFADTGSYDFLLKNLQGNIVLHPNGYVDISGELKIKGISISTIYVANSTFTIELAKKVNAINGKQLSTEDFTSALKAKLESIKIGSVGSPEEGYVTAKDITEHLAKKMTIALNFSDLADKAAARVNLSVFSRQETNDTFLKITSNLQELVNLTADEINGLTPEQASALKAQKQASVRIVLDAEKKGTGDLKLAKASNLSDLQDKTKARQNISVYSIEEMDNLLRGKLSVDSEYGGEIFTNQHKIKLEGIKTGVFAGIDVENKPISQVEGYVMTSHVVKELEKKANLLMDGYNDTQKKTIATNIGVYNKSESDIKYASIESLFQDFIAYLVKQGKTTSEAQKLLRDKLNAPSKEDVTNNYLRKDGKLSDLALANKEAKKLACSAIGAAFAEEYETKIKDTGWIQMLNSGSKTDTRKLFARQIGNIVSIQGSIHNGNHDGEWWGGVVAIIPNQIQPPKYAIKNSLCSYNNDHKYNRGASYVIWGGDRRIIMYESGWNTETEINFTYMV